MIALVTPGVRSNLYRFALSITKHPWAAENVLDDSIVKAVSRVESSRVSKFLPYLKTILRNAAFDWVRRFKKQQDYLHLNHDLSTRSAFAEAISQEALEIFDGIVSKLPKRMRRIIIMRVVDRLSFGEISKKVKISKVYARGIFFRAKEKLRSLLAYRTEA
jgi:RNA polymerase sigma factor (sigma-70 family)